MCSSVDEFDELLQSTTLEWGQSNFFIDPYPSDKGDPLGWYEFISLFWEKYPTHFEKRPIYKNGQLFINCVGLKADLDQFQERSGGEFELNEFKEKAIGVLDEVRAQIAEARTAMMPVS